mmetsp:Transcript_88827/g.176604  ORF Transcript_88827/g.176604 Transcript_88827/m.176604 type:complete len:331 (+) Transcript_88827:61-1053(+)
MACGSSGLGLPGMNAGMLKEHWLRHLCNDDERAQLLDWLKCEGLQRPQNLDDRLEHAAHLRALGNEWYARGDLRRALHCMLGAVHALDWVPAEQLAQSDDQRQQVAESLLPVLGNLAMVLLKRGSFEAVQRAATAGLRCAQKLPAETCAPLRAKLRYRRALARGEEGPSRDLDGALEDLQIAARLEPTDREIRACLETCKNLLRKERAVSREARDKSSTCTEARTLAGPTSAVDDRLSTEDSRKERSVQESELSPAAECFARVVGRCLGRCRRRCRKTTSFFNNLFAAARGHAKVSLWRSAAAVALLGPILGALALLVIPSQQAVTDLSR